MVFGITIYVCIFFFQSDFGKTMIVYFDVSTIFGRERGVYSGNYDICLQRVL